MAPSVRTLNLLAAGLVAVGLLQMLGHGLGSDRLRGLGALTVASPYPKVFADVKGLETFASDFYLEWREDDAIRRVKLTPALYANLPGPYNRRNVYGAALSYAPRLPEPLWHAVFDYGLRPGGPLRPVFYVPPHARGITLHLRTKTQGRNDEWRLTTPALQ